MVAACCDGITSEENNEIPESIIPVQISLKPGKTKQIELPDFTITDDYPPGTYSIKAAIEAKRKSISQKVIPFEIAGTSKPFKMKILLSSDRENLKNQKIFYKEDKELYVQVISKVKDIRITGTVIDPKKNKTELTFTENYATYPLKGPGPYAISIITTAPGYRTNKQKVHFNVIKKRPVIKKMVHF